jgi:oxaloacetate decarboxylase gamma subunit
MEINLVAEGLKFMVLGMGVVFVFLALLVQVMKWQNTLISKYFPTKESPPNISIPDDEKSRIAAIVAAVTEFRKRQ